MCNTNDFNIDEIALSEFGEVTFLDHDGLIENLTEIATEREDPWNEYPAVKPDQPEDAWLNGKTYIVESNRGVNTAVWMGNINLNKWWFQDTGSGDNEGKYGWGGEPYTVYRWMELPEGKCEKE